MLKAYNMEGSTCYVDAENMESLKGKLRKMKQNNKLDSQDQPILVFEHDEDKLSRPLFQKVHIAYNI